MKRGLNVFIVLGLILILSLTFVSAGWFSNLFNKNKITGKVVGEATWEIEDPIGICDLKGGLFIEADNTSVSIDPSLRIDCAGYSSSTECTSNPICYWNTRYVNVMDNFVNVHQGWNLLYGLYSPMAVSGGNNIVPKDIKAIYLLNPFTKTSFEYFPELNTSAYINGNLQGVSDLERILSGLIPSRFLAWVYFDKAGSLKYRFPDGYELPLSSINAFGDPQPPIAMIKGWNFLGITPGMFEDLYEIKQSTFTLDKISGNCHITKAYFFWGTYDNPQITDQWVQVGLGDAISNAELFRSLVVNVSDNCFLGKTSPGITCEDTDGSINLTTKGTVTITNNGNIYSETDSCSIDENGVSTIYEKYCRFAAYAKYYGPVKIGTFSISGRPDCPSCMDGVCIYT